MTIAPYGSSPVFDETTLPDALRNEHSTKAGTWGLLRVLEGEVDLVFEGAPGALRVSVDNPAMIPPEAPHHVVVDGPMRMQVEFYREPPLPIAGNVGG
ncbi:MAG: DUF1971 domain-containing protein [Sphingorhabdus sp.]